MRVLIADDDPTALLLLESALVEWGYEVVRAQDGNEAWEMLHRSDHPPLAILDWMMPGMDGIEICRKLRHESDESYVYLILLTGKTSTRDIVAGMEAGADDYVSKPFEEQELKVRLRAGRRIAELNEALRIQAKCDALTGIWNRRMILEILEREVARAAREQTCVGVIMADLDHFKRLNDTLGHLAGDAALRAAAKRMSESLRKYDALGRYGGEEFLIVLPGCDAPRTLATAERIRQSFALAAVPLPNGEAPVTVSLGTATSSGGQLSPDKLLRLADDALYRAKRAGRNRALAAEHPDMTTRASP